MSARATLVLMWVFLAVGGWAAYDYFWLKAEREQRAEDENHVARFKGKLLERITLPAGGQTVQLRCASPEGCTPDGAANWLMESPVADRGDSSSIGSLASALLNLTFLEKIDFDEIPDPKEFGFGAKQIEVIFKGEKEPLVIGVGGATAAGPNVYVSSSATPKRLYIVASFFSGMLDKDIFHWRNKRLFPELETEHVSALEWKGKVSLQAEKKGNKWRITKPVDAAANFVMMEGLVSTAVFAAARALEPDAQPTGAPMWEITLRAGEKAEKLGVYPKAKGKTDLLARVNGTGPFYLIDGGQFERFAKPLLEYRERRLFPERDAGWVNEIALSFPREGKKITLTLKEGAWNATGGDQPAESLSQTRIRGLMAALFGTEADAFFPPSSQAARLLRTQPADVELALRGPGGAESAARMIVMQRKAALTSGEGGEARSFSGELLTALPIRFQDLYESNNKLVAPVEKQPDEHQHSHEHNH